MTASRSFKPAVGDRLEDRTVPSGAGVSLWFGASIGDVPSVDARQIVGQFQSFERSFTKDFRTYMSGVKSGSTTAAATFTAAIGTDITNLTTGVDGKIANLASNNATLTSAVNTDISNLQTTLTGLTLPTSSAHRAANQYLNNAFNDIFKTQGDVNTLVRAATPPTGSITASAFNTVLTSVNDAFSTFRKAYNSAITTSTTSPSSNRTAFDAAVGTALGTLNTSLASAVSTLPSAVSSSLDTEFSADILNTANASGNLQTRLSNIATPTSGFFSMLNFRFRSSIAIGNAQDHVVNQLYSAVRGYNNSLT